MSDANYANLQFFIDWHRLDALSMNPLTNSGFETNTAGWSVSAAGGIGSGAVSITRSTTSDYYVTRTDGANGGVGVLVTDAVAGSGTWYAITGTFKTGRTYRYAVAIKRTSGTSAARITVGSFGIGADRATAVYTVSTTDWAVYTVDWSPTADRSDAQVFVGTDTASALTLRFEDAMTYEAINDISADVDTSENAVTLVTGANLDGSAESPGTLNFTLGAAARVDLEDWKYAPENASSDLAGLIFPGRRIWVRAINGGKVYRFFFGTITRFVLRPADIKVDVFCEDPLRELSQTNYTQKGLLQNVWEFRNAIITDAAIDTDTTIHHSFDKAGQEGTAAVLAEDDIFTFANGEDSLSLLAELNKATGTIHACVPDANSDILYRYTTIRRQTLIDTGTIAEHFDDDIADVSGYDITDELLVNRQTVQAHRYPVVGRRNKPESKFKINIAAGATKYYFMTFDEFITGTPTITVLPSGTFTVAIADHFPQALNISVLNPTGSTETLTYVNVSAVMYAEAKMAPISIADATSRLTYGKHRGQDIDSVFCQSREDATSLANYKVNRYSTPRAWPSVSIESRHPSHLKLHIGDRIEFTFARMQLAAKVLVIRGWTTTVSQKGHEWKTDYQTEEID